jgi:hypothetical protein
MMSRIDSRHWKISTSRHFQNGHHNTAQIQHCPISTTFHMWVDYYVPNWFLTSKNFYWSPFSKWPPQYCTNSTLPIWCLWPNIRFLPSTVTEKNATKNILDGRTEVKQYTVLVCRLSWFLYPLNIYAHFSSHFSQQLLMAEIWYLVTSFI